MVVKNLREKANWTQEQLATMCGISIRTIQRVEGGHSASLETLKCLASVFEIDISKLTEEITVIDKKSENWKIQPWWFKSAFWTIYTRRTQMITEISCLALGIITWLSGLTIWLITDAGLMASEIGKFGYTYGLVTGPLLILWAYFTGWTIRHGDKEQLW